MRIIETTITIANKTDEPAELFVVEQELVEDDNPNKQKVSFRSHPLQSEPHSINSTNLDIHADSILIGIVNSKEDIISNNLGMSKRVDLTKNSNVKIMVKKNNVIEVM